MFAVNHPTPTVMVLDDFYENPMAVREWVLQQEFPIVGNYPGKRTHSCATEEIRQHLQKFIQPFTGDITLWSDKDNYVNANGCFQYTLESDVSWMHTDADVTDWAGVLYLTPDAPLSSGTGLYEFKDDKSRFGLQNLDRTLLDAHAQNLEAWNEIDRIGNVFNRLILFNAQHWHRSLDYFGDSKENGRLFQLFFFSTEKKLTDNIKIPEPVMKESNLKSIKAEIKSRQPFAMQIDVHGVPTQYESQIPINTDSGESKTYDYHPLNLWEAIHRPLIKDIEGQKVLDVGCNSGFFSFELAKRGADVMGVDNNQVERVFNRDCMPLQQAKWIESELKTGAKFKEMDFMYCDESKPYDKILFLGVYYHLKDPSRGLAKLNRLMKMGGELYLECETHPTETTYYDDNEEYRLDSSNFLIPTPEYLNEDMKRNGFEILETFRTRDICCGNRYAVRAIKISDDPKPANTFDNLNNLQTPLDSLTEQSEHQRIKNEIEKRGPFFQRINIHGVYTSANEHPNVLWDAIRPSLSNVAGKKMLDIGCNAGFFCFEAAKLGAEVLGIDNNQHDEYDQDYSNLSGGLDNRKYSDWIEQAEWIESELKTGTKFEIMDLFDCDHYGDYDVVLFLGVYYHLEKPSEGLRQINKLLQMGGELYIEGEVNKYQTRYFEKGEEYENDPSVFLVATPEYIIEDLESNGFTVVEHRIIQTGAEGRQRWYGRAVKTKDLPRY